jgi:alkaline phosphatase
MLIKRPTHLVGVALLAVLTLLSASVAVDARAEKPLARNVILMIDDGAGYNHHQAGSLYDTGLREGEAYNDFPFRYAVSTDSYGDVAVNACPANTVGYDPSLAWSDFDYVLRDPTDSAAAATAMATGTKTYDSAIGVDCAGQPVQSVVEVFEELDKSTGVITTVPFSHATPGAFAAHHWARDEESAIGTKMIESSATDVIMGGGHPEFGLAARPSKVPNYRWIEQADLAALRAGTAGGDADGDAVADPWTLIETRDQFQALMTGDTPSRVFGLAQVRQSMQVDRTGDAQADPFVVPFTQSVPTLTEMTIGALNVLDNNDKGFFLMIEGGATDLASHDGLRGRMIEEEIAFDRAVDAVLEWVDQSSNWGKTLVVVTSDHETGYLTGPGSGPTADGPVWMPLGDNGAGETPDIVFNSPADPGKYAHTNSLVPVYAKGDAGRLLRHMVDGTDPVRGRYVDNTDIHQLLIDAVAPHG